MFSALWSRLGWTVSGATWKKVLVVTFAGLFVLLCYWGASAINESTKTGSPSAPKSTVSPQSEQTFWGWVIAITIVIALVWLYRHKRAGGATIGQVLIGPIHLSPIMIFIGWAFIAFALPEQWRWIWEHQILFWLVSLGVVTLAMVASVGNKASAIAFKVIALILVLGICFQLQKDLGHVKLGWFEDKPRRITVLPKPIEVSGAPSVVALGAIADCESGDGAPGSAHQFNDDGSPVRNPSDGLPGTGAVGMFQINLSDPVIARLVKEKGWDVEGSLADNRAAAEYILETEGLGPWEASRHCWEPRVREANIGTDSSPVYLLRLIAPVGDFGDEVSLPTGSYKVSWGDNPGAFVVRNELGEEARYIPKQRVYQNLPMIARLRLKSLETEPVPVKIKLSN